MGDNANKRTKGTRVVTILMVLLLILILIAAAGFLYTRYTRINGQFLRTDTVELDLSHQGISDLSPLERCRELKTLDVRGNPLTVEDVRSLEKQLPYCDILFDVTINGQAIDSTVTELTLDDLPEDWETVLLLRHLRSLRVERCTNPAAMETIREELPYCDAHWNLGLGGEWYDADIRELNLPGTAVYFEELLAQLPWFRSLETVSLRSVVLTAEQQRTLMQNFPSIHFSWPVSVGEAIVPSSAEELVFSMTGLTETAPLEAVLDLLPELRCVDFTGSPASAEERLRFRKAHPELETPWKVHLMGGIYPSDTEMLDFNSIYMPDTREIEEALPYFPELKRVEMCRCGLSDEQMDALSHRWPDVRFIWEVYFSVYELRTDATYFCASAIGVDHPYLRDSDLEVFRYLVDMEALDLGHMSIYDLSFVKYMPHLKYLIIAECPISDLSPLASCQELKYLEIFKTNVYDISPLTECPSLESLNMCYVPVSQPNAYDNLMKMESLGRLWYCNCPMNGYQRAEFQKAHPDCICFFLEGGEPSGGSWRYDQRYYDMRDALHMAYMPGGTNGLDEDGSQIIVDDWGQQFILKDFDNNPYWWTDPRYSDMYPHIIGVTI